MVYKILKNETDEYGWEIVVYVTNIYNTEFRTYEKGNDDSKIHKTVFECSIDTCSVYKTRGN